MKFKYFVEYILNVFLSFLLFKKREYYQRKALYYLDRVKKCKLYNDIKIINKRKVKINVQGQNNQIYIGNIIGQGKVCINILGDNNYIFIDKIISDGILTIMCHCFNGKIELNSLSFGPNLTIYNGYSVHYKNIKNPKIMIGENTSINSGFIFNPHSNTSINIGNDCMFSDNIQIRNTDGHPIYDITTNECLNKLKENSSIYIGNHVWIGYGATILKNTAILNNSIVGTQAVVTKKFDNQNVVIAGNPAKIVKKNVTWEKDNIVFFN